MSWLSKLIKDVSREIENGIESIKDFPDNIIKESESAFDNVQEAFQVSANFLEDQFAVTVKYSEDIIDNVASGDIKSAIFDSHINYIDNYEENLTHLFLDSSLLNSIAGSAAAVYGGPVGAGAYAAWFAYKKTGDLKLAIKAGIVSGLANKGLKYSGDIDSKNIEDAIKKAIMTGAIGGASIAASGGDERAIIQGFVKGANFSMARDYYYAKVGSRMDGKIADKGPIGKKVDITQLSEKDGNHVFKHEVYEFDLVKDNGGAYVIDENGLFTISTRSIDENFSHVGLAFSEKANLGFVNTVFNEKSCGMQALAKIPYMNDMAYFHDQWMDIKNASGWGAVQVTIIPAAILTVSGSEMPLNRELQKSIISEQLEDGSILLKNNDTGDLMVLKSGLVSMMSNTLKSDPIEFLDYSNVHACGPFQPYNLGVIGERFLVASIEEYTAIKIQATTSENNYIQPWEVYAWRAYEFQPAGIKVISMPIMHTHSSGVKWEIDHDGFVYISKDLYDTGRVFYLNKVEIIRGGKCCVYSNQKAG